MADHLRKYEMLYAFELCNIERDRLRLIYRFTLTPQRMRMVVEAFKDALELGLEKTEQIVVRLISSPV